MDIAWKSIARDDGSVAIMVMLPVQAVSEDGKSFAISGVSGDSLNTELGLLRLPCPIQDLMPDSLDGLTLVFPSPDDEIAKWHDAHRATVVSISPLASVPPDRSYRDAWTYDGAAISHDMGKAREIHRNKIRAARAPLFAVLDIEYQRADETGDKAAKAAIAARKVSLRDATRDPQIDAANTIDALKQAWPKALS
jgi:hypothetical protein